ncbi:MAG: ABC transporter permease [Thermoprotei archaeon]|nr:MAG: ABC transporter permease [Thermoprotei archaeon]
MTRNIESSKNDKKTQETSSESTVHYIDTTGPAKAYIRKKSFWAKVRDLRLSIKISFLVLIVLALMTIFAEWLAPHNPYEPNLQARNNPPSLTHPLGTDYIGRDTLSRTIYALRTSVGIAMTGVIVGTLLGATLGIAAGLFKGIVDRVVSSLIDFFYAIPNILIVLIGIAVFGTETWVLIALISFARWHSTARVVRGQVYSLVTVPSVEAAIALGSTYRRVAVKHLLPNLTSVLVVDMTMKFPALIILESTLSFLGLGVQPPIASLGAMIGDGRDYLISAPLIALSPSLFLVGLVMCFQIIGDWIRDLSDVRQFD